MTWWLIAILGYLAGAAVVAALWRRAHRDGDDPEWGLCAFFAILWPLILFGGLL